MFVGIAPIMRTGPRGGLKCSRDSSRNLHAETECAELLGVVRGTAAVAEQDLGRLTDVDGIDIERKSPVKLVSHAHIQGGAYLKILECIGSEGCDGSQFLQSAIVPTEICG